MAANQNEIGAAIKEKLMPIFMKLGLELDNIVIQNLSLPDELQAALDSRIGVNIMGGMQDFTKFQVASSIPLAARNEGGLAGLGAGVGVGLGVGQEIAHMFSSAGQSAIASTLSGDEVIATIEKLHALVNKGVLSQQEYDSKKTELLAKLN